MEKIIEWLTNMITNPLLIIGLLLLFLAAIFKDERSVKAGVSKGTAIPWDKRSTLRPLPYWLYLTLDILGVLSIIVGMLQLGGIVPTYFPSPPQTPLPTYNSVPAPGQVNTSPSSEPITIPAAPQIHLAGASYMLDQWNPREINLLTAEQEGISVYEGAYLELFDLWISVPQEADHYFVGSEVYGGGELLGTSGFQKVEPGFVKLNDFKVVQKDNQGNGDNAWVVGGDWEKLDIYIYLYPADEPGVPSVSTSQTTIRLSDRGSSWYVSPPYGHIVAIEYSINDGQPQVMDFTQALTSGLAAAPGDQVRFTKVWYKTDDATYGHKLRLEAYLSSGGYDGEREINEDYPFEEKGVYEITDLSPYVWTVLENDTTMIITLSRDDNTVLDRYVIPLQK